MSSELVKIGEDEVSTALEIYQKEGGLDPLIEKIEKQVRSEIYEVETEAGRKHLHNVGKSIGGVRTRLEEAGKDLTEADRIKIKKVNDAKSHMVTRLNALRDETIAPLVAWKEEEKKRIEEHQKALYEIHQSGDMAVLFSFTAEDLLQKKNWLAELPIDDTWEEFKQEAVDAKDASLEILGSQYKVKVHQEEQDGEIARLKKESAIFKEAQEKEKLRRETAEKLEENTRQAEIKAKSDAQEKIEDANRATLEAQAKADRAVEDERRRVEDERINKEAEDLKRKADDKHRATLNQEVVDGLMEADSTITKAVAVNVLKAIANGKVKNVSINY